MPGEKQSDGRLREGGRRLKNKNVASFAGTNLLLNKIEQLKKVSEIERIVVTSDSDMMLAMAESAGALTHKRALEFCDESTKTFGEVVRHVAENVEGGSISCGRPVHSHGRDSACAAEEND